MPKPKKSVQKASVMSGSANFDDNDDNIMEMDDLIEESVNDEVDGDMLESNKDEAMQIEHVEQKDPKMEEADKQIEKELDNIPPKFEKTAEKKPAAKRPSSSARPTTAKAPAKKPVAATKKAAPAPPSEKDVLNAKKAAARASSKSKALKAEAAPKPGPPRKKVDAEKLKQNIKDSKQKKQEEAVKSIQKLKQFKMPKQTPKLGGTEMDLEQQIEDDLLNLKLEMDT